MPHSGPSLVAWGTPGDILRGQLVTCGSNTATGSGEAAALGSLVRKGELGASLGGRVRGSHLCLCTRAAAAAAAAESLQSCPTLCDPIDGSPPGSPVPGILQARTLEWVAIAFSSV